MKMNQPQTRKLVVLLSALACLVVLVVILDSMPKSRPVDLPQDITELPQDSDTTDTTASDTNSDTVTELPSSEDISPSVTDTDSTESVTEESIADSTDVPLSNGTETVPPNTVTQPSLLLTFLGECAPGSPLGTTAYGSLNAKIAAEGVDDFWSDILPLLQEDDYTIASNHCLFSDSPISSTTLICEGPAANAAIYPAGSIELLTLPTVAAPEELLPYWAETNTVLTEEGVSCLPEDTVTYLSHDGFTVAVITPYLSKSINRTGVQSSITEAKSKADYVIVYFRGGEVNAHTPEEWLTASLRSYADAGASLIVGSGTGVLRPVEKYGSCTIAYSLGSMLDGSSVPVENIALLLRLALTREEDGSVTDTLEFIPCLTFDTTLWEPSVMDNTQAKEMVFRFLSGECNSPVLE